MSQAQSEHERIQALEEQVLQLKDQFPAVASRALMVDEEPIICQVLLGFKGKAFSIYQFDDNWEEVEKGVFKAKKDGAQLTIRRADNGNLQDHKFKKDAKVTRDGNTLNWDTGDEQ